MSFERLPESVQTLYAELFEQARHAEADDGDRTGLCRMLAVGGAARASTSAAKVFRLLAGAGVFRAGGVLLGTWAFSILGNVLGVCFEPRARREAPVRIALPLGEISPEGPLFVPELDPRHPSTSYKIRGRELRVDFLTPLHGREPEKPVFLPALGVSAHPLRFLDYLIESPAQAAIVGGSGVLVNVPDPARFAFHKLWISRRRPVSEQAKAAKDLRQAGSLLEVLLEDRPADLPPAWEALGRSPTAREAVTEAIQRLDPEVRDGLARRLGEAGRAL